MGRQRGKTTQFAAPRQASRNKGRRWKNYARIVNIGFVEQQTIPNRTVQRQSGHPMRRPALREKKDGAEHIPQSPKLTATRIVRRALDAKT